LRNKTKARDGNDRLVPGSDFRVRVMEETGQEVYNKKSKVA
jgi:hypothetical protein